MILRCLVGFGNRPGAAELNGSYALAHISTEALRNLYKIYFEWKQDAQMPCIAQL